MPDEPGRVAFSERRSEACAAKRDFDTASCPLGLEMWIHLPPPRVGGELTMIRQNNEPDAVACPYFMRNKIGMPD